MNDLGRLIFLDRYAKKDPSRTMKIGDEIVLYVDLESKQRELGVVVGVAPPHVTVQLKKTGEPLTVLLEHTDRPIEDPDGAYTRMSEAVASVERVEEREKTARVFHHELARNRIVPAGRVWAGAGVEEKLTPYNCYVLPPPHDSRHGIIETLGQMTEIFARGGGVGFPLMTLRPRHALVHSVNGRSSGSVLWSEIYSFNTGLIEQGGSRRGALMLIHYAWHPDIFDFVTAKRDMKKLTNANISVAIPDAFMEAVEKDGSWDLVFPETSHPDYDKEWDGDIDRWKALGRPVKVYRTIRARELWDEIVKSAHASAEPGLFFVDYYNALSNAYYYPQGRIWATNPCGEQGIPSWAVCNLGHLHLAKFLIGTGLDEEPAKVDWALLRKSIRQAVRFMDNVIDVAFVPFKENDEQQKSERRIGLGTMGLAEMLIRCHIRYGRDEKCLAFLDALYRFIAVEAYIASSDLATEKGSFPLFNADKFLASGFMKTMPDNVRSTVRRGMRNVCLLTQAPTGTVGTMMNTSTGIEPFVWWEWQRTGRLGTHAERVVVYDEYLQAHPDVAAKRAVLSGEEQWTTSKFLPDWFVTSAELTPEDHAYTQAAIQRWVDSSISKTSNLPQDFTPDQVGEYYRLLYKLGCKGGTVYRDKSRSEQVLNTPTSKKFDGVELRHVPHDVYDAKCVSVPSPVGKISAKLGIDPETGDPFEVWLTVSRAGTVVSAHSEAMARLLSLLLRLESPVTAPRRLELVVQQLKGIGGGDSTGLGPDRVISVPDSIAKALEKLLGTIRAVPDSKGGVVVSRVMDVCPACHGTTLYRLEGCIKCDSCGYSKC